MKRVSGAKSQVSLEKKARRKQTAPEDASAFSFEIQRAFFPQQVEIPENILLHFPRSCPRIELLQFCNNLLHSMLSVAPLDNFEAGPIQSQRSFGHQQYTG